MNNERGPRLSRRFKRLILIIAILLLLVGIGVCAVIFGPKLFNKKTEKPAEKVVDEIKTFDYAVNENDTKLFKKEFKELKEILSEKEVDNEKYAKAISKLFIIDFFSLENKTSKNDVGGVQFIYDSYKTDFIEYARNGIYKNVINRIDEEKNEDLPLVDSVSIESIDQIVSSTVFDIEPFNTSEEVDAYEVRVTWTYKNSNDYQTSSVLTIVKDNDKLSIAKMTEN